MFEQISDFRNKELFPYKEHRDFYEYLAGFSILVLGVMIGAMLFSDGYDTNVYTELLSVVATIAILDRRSERRDRRREERETKARLLREAGSEDNATAKKAIREISGQGWLEDNDGILQGANLSGANLAGVDLQDANLKGANLEEANLEGADLWLANLTGAILEEVNLESAILLRANLEGAHLLEANLKGAILEEANLESAKLYYANLQGVDLERANLKGANLYYANLEGAGLERANLKGANLRGANLEGADLGEANLDEKTTLPDSEPIRRDNGNLIFNKYWHPETDMRRYTNPDHPDFWQPDWVKE